MSDRLKLLLFIAGVVLVGWLIGWVNVPGAWYAALQKPAFNPPNWVFAPVWITLYILIGIVGWRVWTQLEDGRLRSLWTAQMALNFSWSPVFFGAHRIGLGLIVILLLLATLVAFISCARSRDRVSAWLFVPYVAWVGFASLLNAAIWWLN
jgi:benzodiazapine receptor